MENIRENIKHLQEKREEINKLKNQISEKRTAFEIAAEASRKKFEESLEPLKGKINTVSEEFKLLANDTVSVRLWDLVNELSILTGINMFEMGIIIYTDVEYWGVHSLKYIASNLTNNACWKLKLFANINEDFSKMPSQSFCFEMLFNLNLDEIQADGKTLLEHCSAKVKYHNIQGSHYTVLTINKNIGDIFLKLNLGKLSREDSREVLDRWYPSDLLAQAVINCIERKNNEKKSMESSNFRGKKRNRKLKLRPLK